MTIIKIDQEVIQILQYGLQQHFKQNHKIQMNTLKRIFRADKCH